MNSVLQECAEFIQSTLVPSAREGLKEAFQIYCDGRDIGVEIKNDGSPASLADRETEKRLRELINAAYPEHGIIGEEFGAEHIDAEFVWVLDPLDGTREFLAKECGWGSLIALFQQGKPILGTIIDPLQEKVWDQDSSRAKSSSPCLIEQAVIATTSPKDMFEGTIYEIGACDLHRRCAEVREKLNCLGFAYAADGTVDLAVENKLKLYDIAALLPVLWASGAICLSLDGRDYKDEVFDLKAEGACYSLVIGRDRKLVESAINIINGKMP